jgi:hypothetical protein
MICTGSLLDSEATGRHSLSDQFRQRTILRHPITRLGDLTSADLMHDTTDRTLPYSWTICYAPLGCAARMLHPLLVNGHYSIRHLISHGASHRAIATRALATMPSSHPAASPRFHADSLERTASTFTHSYASQTGSRSSCSCQPVTMPTRESIW